MCFLSYCRSQPPARLISGEEHFSSKKCLAWFYEYAGNEINIRRYQSHALKLFFFLVHSFDKYLLQACSVLVLCDKIRVKTEDYG